MPMMSNFPYNGFQSYGGNNYQQPMQPAPQPYMGQGNSYGAQQQPGSILWVDGEVGAKAYQLPPGWPVGTPMALWDSNDPIIYLKSTNQMGIPNPIRRIRYTMEEEQQSTPLLSSQASNNNEPIYVTPDMSDYVRHDDLNQLKEEIRTMINESKGANKNGKPAV